MNTISALLSLSKKTGICGSVGWDLIVKVELVDMILVDVDADITADGIHVHRLELARLEPVVAVVLQ